MASDYMTNWQAQSILYVWFLNSMEGIRVNEIFEQITGSEPDNYQKNKTPGPNNPFMGVASGNVGKLIYTLQLQPGRLDLVIGPDGGSHEGSEFPLIDIETTVVECTSRILRSGFKSDFVIRQGVVVNAALSVDSVDTGTELITELAAFQPGISDLIDVNIQVNKRMASKSGLALNRILRFSVQTVQEFVLQLGPIGNVVPVTKQSTLASVTIDINSAPSNIPIAIDQQSSIFAEMSDEALRLSSNPSVKGL